MKFLVGLNKQIGTTRRVPVFSSQKSLQLSTVYYYYFCCCIILINHVIARQKCIFSLFSTHILWRNGVRNVILSVDKTIHKPGADLQLDCLVKGMYTLYNIIWKMDKDSREGKGRRCMLGGMELIQFLAALANLHQDNLNNRMNCTRTI